LLHGTNANPEGAQGKDEGNCNWQGRQKKRENSREEKEERAKIAEKAWERLGDLGPLGGG